MVCTGTSAGATADDRHVSVEREPERRGRLVVVATPIGNLGDLSPRAAQALRDADVVAAEDTRRSRVLLDHAGAGTPLTSHHDHNEDRSTAALLERVAAGDVVALVTDAGTPGLSDPGYRVVAAAVERGLPVESVPGPSALLQALALAGLPWDRFCFEGFLPRRAGERGRRLAALAAEERTLVFYVAPHRAAADLAAMAAAFGDDRLAALARELTKLHEEVWRGPLGELAARAAEGVRGEVTVVVAGAVPRVEEPRPDEVAQRVAARMADGADRKTAAAAVAVELGLSRRAVYEASLEREV